MTFFKVEEPSGEDLDHTTIPFGKHRGRTPSEVAEDNPGYIVWMHNHTDRKVSDALYRDCLESMEDMEDSEPTLADRLWRDIEGDR